MPDLGSHLGLRIVAAVAVAAGIAAAIWFMNRDDTPGGPIGSSPQATVSVSPTTSRPPTPVRPRGCKAILAELTTANARIRAVVEGVDALADDHPERVPAKRYRSAARALASLEQGLHDLTVPARLAGLRQLEATIARLARQAYQSAVDQLRRGSAVTLPGLSTQTSVIFSAIDTALAQPLCF